jgi:hypothetical protein
MANSGIAIGIQGGVSAGTLNLRGVDPYVAKPIPLSHDVLQFADDPAAVTSFCATHQVVHEMNMALKLAMELFPDVKTTITLVHHPAENDEWLAINVYTNQETSEVREASQQYVRRWIQMVTWDKMLLIRLIYILL